jgi:hypothetical protein
MKIYNKKCNQCLFGKNKIVSDEAKQQIIADCLKKDTYFSCHKSTIQNKDIACYGFYSKFKRTVAVLRIIAFVVKDKSKFFVNHNAEDLK